MSRCSSSDDGTPSLELSTKQIDFGLLNLFWRGLRIADGLLVFPTLFALHHLGQTDVHLGDTPAPLSLIETILRLPQTVSRQISRCRRLWPRRTRLPSRQEPS